MADEKTFGTKNPETPGNGMDIRSLVRFATGGSEDSAALENTLKAKGYRQKDVRRMVRGWNKVKKNPERNYVLHGDDSFSVTENGQMMGGSGAQKGNVQGFDMGDVLALGRDISTLAGAMQENMTGIVEKNFADRAAEEKVNTEEIQKEFSKELDEGLLSEVSSMISDDVAGPPLPPVDEAIVKGGSSGGKGSKGGEGDKDEGELDIESIFPEPETRTPDASIEGEGIVYDPDKIEASEDPNFWSSLLFGETLADIGNNPWVGGIKGMISGEGFSEGLNDQLEANKLRLDNRIREALANGENSVNDKGALVEFDNEGNITRMVQNGAESPFMQGLLTTPSGGLPGKVVDKLNKPFRYIGNKFSQFFKGGNQPVGNIDDYYKAVEKIQNSNLGAKSKELAMRELTQSYDDIIKNYSKTTSSLRNQKSIEQSLRNQKTTEQALGRQKEAEGVASRALQRKRAADAQKVADDAISRNKAQSAKAMNTGSKPTAGQNTLGEQLSSTLSPNQVSSEIRALTAQGRKSGVLSDGTRIRLGNKSKIWETYRYGGKTKFSK